KLDSPETVKGFATRLAKNRQRLAGLIAQWQAAGKAIAAYGAARSGPTFIVQFCLADAIKFILYDHPQKVNKLSPGHLIPVYPTSELYTRKPDYVVILAWVHARKIVASNPKFLEDGGHFVLLCPDVQIIDANSEEPIL